MQATRDVFIQRSQLIVHFSGSTLVQSFHFYYSKRVLALFEKYYEIERRNTISVHR